MLMSYMTFGLQNAKKVSNGLSRSHTSFGMTLTFHNLTLLTS